MMNVIQKGTKKLKDTRGATMIEYALIITIIAVGAITGLGLIKTAIETKLTEVSDGLA